MTLANNLRQIVKKTPLKPIYQGLRRAYRSRYFRQTITEILTGPEDLVFSRDILNSLYYGWGNPSHAADIDFLNECAHYVAESKLPILECGSGLTTIIAGIVAQKTGNTIWSLEHSKPWYRRVKKYSDLYHINSIKISYTPLIDYVNFTWYDPPLDSMPEKFSCVICDGPSANNKGGRYGLLPIMK